MHHLGHIFLAEAPAGFQFGAFIADGIRGKRLEELPYEMQLGVYFHRWVDWQTDRHPAFQAMRGLLRSVAGRYAGLIADLWLDVGLGYFWTKLTTESLIELEERFRVEILPAYEKWAPPAWTSFLHSLKNEKLLLRFASAEGMRQHLRRFIERRSLPLDSDQIEKALLLTEETLFSHLWHFWREAVSWRSTADQFAQRR